MRLDQPFTITGNKVNFIGKKEDNSKILFSTDLDVTLLDWEQGFAWKNIKDRKFDNTQFNDVLTFLKRNSADFHVMLNTGKTFDELKELKPFITGRDDIQIDSISLRNGKELLIRPDNKSTADWLDELLEKHGPSAKDVDVEWREINQQPVNKVGEFLKQQGFILNKHEDGRYQFIKKITSDDIGVNELAATGKWPPYWQISIKDDQLAFSVTAKSINKDTKVDVKSYTSNITSKIENFLKENDYQISKPKVMDVKQCDVYIDRKDINKKTVADHVRKTHPEVEAEIRAGDAYNDVEMLSDLNIKPIQVGNNPELDSIKDRQDLVKVERGQLLSGLLKHYYNVKSSSKD